MKSMHSQQGGMRTSSLFMQDAWRPGLHYHIIGKAVPGEVLFREEVDYRRFLRKGVRDKLRDVFEFHAYCLLQNHFHFGVLTRSEADVRDSLAKSKKLTATDGRWLNGEIEYKAFVAERFRSAFMQHSKYYNAKYNRSGQLFMKPTLHGLTDKGKPGKEFSRKMIAYVGLNYVKHKLKKPNEYYHWSSMCRALYDIVDLDVDRYFGSKQAYLNYHIQYLRRYGANFYAFDEDELFSGIQPRHYDEHLRKWVSEKF